MRTTKGGFFSDESLCRRDFLSASVGTLAVSPVLRSR